MPKRVMLYVQHLLGIGHLRRTALIARALDAAGIQTFLVSGGQPVSDLSIGGAEYIQLPPAHAADAGFSALLDQAGVPVDDGWWQRRTAALLASFENSAPDCLVTELFPFGRRQFSFELVPLLDAARKRTPRPLILSSVRDILVASTKPGRVEEAVGRARSQYDHVLVHGDPGFARLEESYPAVAQIGGKLVYTGFVTNEMPDPTEARGCPPAGDDEILVSAGGGAVGGALMQSALTARTLSSRACDKTWRLLIGQNAPGGTLEALRAAAPDGVIVEPARNDFGNLLRHCAASVSQAGYNTVMDIFRARAPAVLIPFAEGNETEQAARAETAARRGFAEHLPQGALTPDSLAAALDRALDRGPPTAHYPAMDGAGETARWIAARLADG